jgi:chromosome partitioning protein
VKTIAFFNNKGGVGKTSLVFHLAWILKELGHRVAVADLDPQANVTTFFLGEDRAAALLEPGSTVRTIYQAFLPLLEGIGDLSEIVPQTICDGLTLIPGDLALSSAEGELSTQWSQTLSSDEAQKKRAFRIVCSFYRAIDQVARRNQASIILIDVGPNLGPLNRTALVASDYVVLPIGSDAFSLQGLKNVGKTLTGWRIEWAEKRARLPHDLTIAVPQGEMKPLGYVLSRFAMRAGRPAKAYFNWASQMPSAYSHFVLGLPNGSCDDPEKDPNCLAQLKDYRSLMPMAQDANKPIFQLRAADGAIGAHQAGVADARRDFELLADKILQRM